MVICTYVEWTNARIGTIYRKSDDASQKEKERLRWTDRDEKALSAARLFHEWRRTVPRKMRQQRRIEVLINTHLAMSIDSYREQEQDGGFAGGSFKYSKEEKTLEARLPAPEGPIQQTWSNAETQWETRGGFRGDKEAWFWNDEVQRVVRQKKSAYKRLQRTRAAKDLAAYKTSKMLFKAAVSMAKSTEMDAWYEKFDS
ncbi:hypothetical protein V3C99_019015 [Haemonchus contortus]|uniref:Reverse transcriptase domain-containing protein n=1 Tax=Haemonchus contortus TaxID=6289 RepID=A0A7I5EDL7_HAECO